MVARKTVELTGNKRKSAAGSYNTVLCESCSLMCECILRDGFKISSEMVGIIGTCLQFV
jgi:hypothetical protein